MACLFTWVLIYFFYFLCRIKSFSVVRVVFYFFVSGVLASLISFEVISKLSVSSSGNGFDLELWKKIIDDTGAFWSYKHPRVFFANIVFPFFFFYMAAIETEWKTELIYLFIGYSITQVIHFLVFDIFFVPLLVKSAIFNAHYYMAPLMLILCCVILVKFLLKKDLSYLDIAKAYVISLIYILYVFVPPLKIPTLILVPSMIFFLGIANIMKIPSWLTDESYDRRRSFSIILLICGIISICGFYYTQEIRNNIKTSELNFSWFDIQQWVTNNTNKTDRFIIPFTDHTLHGMRIYGERSALCLKPLELHFIVLLDSDLTIRAVKEFTSSWDVPKKDDIPINFSAYDLFEYSTLTGNNLQRSDLLELKNKFENLNYIITDGREIQDVRLAYQNRDFKIFEIE